MSELMNERERGATVTVRGLAKSFPLPNGERLEILRGIDFDAAAGEAVAIMGTSGCGKTTLLHILAGIEPADLGTVKLAGGRPGLIFQAHYLLPELDALENVALAARLVGEPRAVALERALRLLDEVGLAARAQHLPAELSGGETARVAIARALAADPEVLLADEPTGNLDEDTSQRVQDLLFATVKAHRKTLVIVTHDPGVAARATRTRKLEHGALR